MKRLITTLIAIFYLGVSSGATVHLHYCMGQLVEWSMVSKSSEKCGKCGMKSDASKDCCKHDQKQFKIESAQKISQNSFLLKAASLDLGLLPYRSETDIYVSSLIEVHPGANAPPETQSTPAFIRNCNFRI